MCATLRFLCSAMVFIQILPNNSLAMSGERPGDGAAASSSSSPVYMAFTAAQTGANNNNGGGGSSTRYLAVTKPQTSRAHGQYFAAVTQQQQNGGHGQCAAVTHRQQQAEMPTNLMVTVQNEEESDSWLAALTRGVSNAIEQYITPNRMIIDPRHEPEPFLRFLRVLAAYVVDGKRNSRLLAMDSVIGQLKSAHVDERLGRLMERIFDTVLRPERSDKTRRWFTGWTLLAVMEIVPGNLREEPYERLASSGLGQKLENCARTLTAHMESIEFDSGECGGNEEQIKLHILGETNATFNLNLVPQLIRPSPALDSVRMTRSQRHRPQQQQQPQQRRTNSSAGSANALYMLASQQQQRSAAAVPSPPHNQPRAAVRPNQTHQAPAQYHRRQQPQQQNFQRNLPQRAMSTPLPRQPPLMALQQGGSPSAAGNAPSGRLNLGMLQTIMKAGDQHYEAGRTRYNQQRMG